MKLIFLLFYIAVCFGSLNAKTKRDHNDYTKNPMRIVCYVGTWAVYHKNAPFTIEDIDPSKCTHINYGFAKIDEYKYTIQVFDPYQDDNKNSWEKRGYDRFNNLRKTNPQLSTFISVGGWYEGSEKYSDMAANPSYRKAFIDSVLAFLKEYDFDGLDLDWEYPGSRLGNPKIDKQNFLSLIKELKEALDPHGYLLTAAVSPGKDKIDVAYDLTELDKLFDWWNVMTYDYHGGWENKFGHNAPLYKRPEETDDLHTFFTVNYTMNYYLSKGVSPKNLVMGVPFYGRAWTIEDQTKTRLGDPAKGKSPAGFISGEEGVLGYIELCQLFKEKPEEWTFEYNEYYNAPFAFNKEIWVGYDDLKSISCKLSFLKHLGVSGVMVWSLESDDFLGKCGSKYPLLNKVYNMINGIEKNSMECLLGPTTTTPVPTTTTTTPEPTTTTTTPEPTTTTTTPEPTTTTTTPEPTTTTTTPEPTTTTTTPEPTTTTTTTTTPQPTTTSKPTTPTQAPTTSSPTATPVYTTMVDGHHVKCYKQGPIPHPTNIHKYIVCSYVATKDGGGWWIQIMPCPIGTRWHDPLKVCIQDD